MKAHMPPFEDVDKEDDDWLTELAEERTRDNAAMVEVDTDTFFTKEEQEERMKELKARFNKTLGEMEEDKRMNVIAQNGNDGDHYTTLDIQIGGSHYKNYKIQPVEYIMANNLNYCQANVIKYVTRYKDKNGVEDLEKAKHYIDLLIELEEKKSAE